MLKNISQLESSLLIQPKTILKKSLMFSFFFCRTTEPSTLLRMLVAGFCALWCRGEIVCHRAVIPYTTKLYSKLLVCNHRAESVSATFLGFPPPKLLSDAHLRQTHNCLSAGLIPSHPVILFTDLENLVVSRGGGAKIYASPSSGWEVRPSYTGSPNLRRDSPDL